MTVGELVTTLIEKWKAKGGEALEPLFQEAVEAERSVLILDSTKAESFLRWNSMLDLDTAIDWTVDWYSQALGTSSFDARSVTSAQIAQFLQLDRASCSKASSYPLRSESMTNGND